MHIAWIPLIACARNANEWFFEVFIGKTNRMQHGLRCWLCGVLCDRLAVLVEFHQNKYDYEIKSLEMGFTKETKFLLMSKQYLNYLNY